MVHVDWLIISIGLLVGTYVVRALPFWFSGIERLPPRVHRFLELVPAAALGALIFPDALTQVDPMVALPVLGIAFVLAMRGINLTAVVAASIAVAWLGVVLL